MPVVENQTEDEIEYRVNDDPPFEDPPYGRPEHAGPPKSVAKRIPPRAGVEFEVNKDLTQSHFIRLHNGVFLRLLQNLPYHRKVTFRREEGSDVCSFEVTEVDLEKKPGKK